eukprot:gene24862-33350_t
MGPMRFLCAKSLLVQRNGNNNDASSGFYIRKTTPHNTKVTYRRDSLSSVFQLRSGNSFSALSSIALANPQALFNALLVSLAALAVIGKTAISINRSESEDSNDKKPPAVRSLQIKFLAVFWLMRLADWLQGPYFYEVYSSKLISGNPVSLDLVSKLFLVGFASTGLFGPWIGRFVDSVGRKAGTIAYAVLYSIGALSTRSNILPLLLLGRVAGGLGTSLLFSAPEAWLVGEYQKLNTTSGKWLGETFGWAYAGDSLVAILAGQLAALTAAKEGPTGPFTLSVLFLSLGSLLAIFNWSENVAPKSTAASSSSSTSSESGSDSGDTPAAAAAENNSNSISAAISAMSKDPRILLLGAVQALFEGAMYIFVLQWPPAIKAAILASPLFTQSAGALTVPFGNIFSCFMACCLLGSTLFGALQASGKIKVEMSFAAMLYVAAAAISAATFAGVANLPALIAAFFIFEVCVGMYFPSIGTLRSKYLPDAQRSVIMNLFGIPLNLIVVSVFLSINSLGVNGALGCASVALGIASICMTLLARKATKALPADASQ